MHNFKVMGLIAQLTGVPSKHKEIYTETAIPINHTASLMTRLFSVIEAPRTYE